jgi:hypothetical protein
MNNSSNNLTLDKTPEITHINLDKLELNRYRFYPVTHKLEQPALTFIRPLLVHQQDSGELALLDGFTRYESACAMDIDQLPCQILSPETPLTNIIALLTEQHENVLNIPIHKANFVAMMLNLGLSREQLCEHFLTPIGLSPHIKLIRHCLAIHELPEEVQQFCANKKLSFKQCLALTLYPCDLVMEVLDWRNILHLSSSNILELLEHIHDILRSTNSDIKIFRQSPTILHALQANQPPHEKTRLMRTAVENLRFPDLTAVREDLSRIHDQMALPKTVRCQWDQSLEKSSLYLQIDIHSQQQWQGLLDLLNSTRLTQGIKQLLEKL